MDSISLVLLRLRSVLHSLYINLVYVHVGRFWINITLVTLVWESHASHYNYKHLTVNLKCSHIYYSLSSY